MAEEEQGTSPEESPEKGFKIQLIYLKDASFETPNSPGIFTTDWKQPVIKIALSHHNEQMADNTYEVVQTITVTATVGDTIAYLAEVQQAGIFTMVGIEPDNLHRLLNSYCPGLLYPYTREAISSLVTKGGFPSISLGLINFDALYERKLEKEKEKESAAAEVSD
jgi:preprotein translocase subunit SecB